MTLTVRDLCLLQLSLIMLVPSLMLIMVFLKGHRAAEISSQMNQYVFHNMQVDLVAS